MSQGLNGLMDVEANFGSKRDVALVLISSWTKVDWILFADSVSSEGWQSLQSRRGAYLQPTAGKSLAFCDKYMKRNLTL
jgi:hypothetical protein